MNLLILSVIFCSVLNYSFGITNEISMIVDVVTSYETPTGVVAKLCWNFSEKVKLASLIMDPKIAKSIAFIKEAKELDKFQNTDTLIIMDLDCQDENMFLSQVNSKMFIQTRWLILPIQKSSVLPRQLDNLNIVINSQVMVAYEEHGKIKLSLVYKIDKTHSFRIENYGVWSNDKGLIISEDMNDTMLIRRKNLEGKEVVTSLVAVNNGTKNDLYALKHIVIDNVPKSTFHQLLIIYDFMNASKVITFTNSWGYLINNTWSGMTGDIHQGRAELCGAVSFMTLERLRVTSFMTQTIPITSKIIFQEPPLSFQNNLYLLPFKSAVWMSVGILVFVLIIILYATAKWEDTLADDLNKTDPTQLHPNLSDITIYVLSAMTQQGCYSELKGSLGRVVTFLMFLIFLFLYTSYSANIVALLQSSSDQIRTLTDLLNSRLELGVEDESYNRHYYPTATEPIRKALYETKVAKSGYKPNFMSLDDGVTKLKNKAIPFAFHMNTGMGYKKVDELFEEHEKCGLREIEYYSNPRPWLCSSKTSPYKEIYKLGAIRAIEHGLADRVNRIFYARKPKCNMRGGSFGSVNMVDFHPVLLMLVYGMVMAILLLILEIITHKKLRVLTY